MVMCKLVTELKTNTGNVIFKWFRKIIVGIEVIICIMMYVTEQFFLPIKYHRLLCIVVFDISLRSKLNLELEKFSMIEISLQCINYTSVLFYKQSLSNEPKNYIENHPISNYSHGSKTKM